MASTCLSDAAVYGLLLMAVSRSHAFKHFKEAWQILSDATSA